MKLRSRNAGRNQDGIGRTRRRVIATGAAIAVLAGLTVSQTGASLAHADTAPSAGTPATFAADPLPTMQVNGIVWAEVTVGNTVYATGNFTQARPAGAKPNTQLTPAANIVAFDITTGKQITSFSHKLNGQGRTLALSPNGARLYIGGDFTTIDGAAHNHIGAINLTTDMVATGFTASVGDPVYSIVATASTVYVGGSFQTAGGKVRKNLAAFTTAGALTTWDASADDNFVDAMVLSPDQSKLIVGGHFSTLNGVAAPGMGALNATNGATLPWAANKTVQDYGVNAAISTLTTDGTQIYGAGWAVTADGGNGNLEGRFAADPTTGAINWVNDCHGDSYATLPIGQILYSVGHAHDCTAVGSFPNNFPVDEPMHHLIAETTYPTGTNVGPDAYGFNFNAVPDVTVLDWFPNQTPAPAKAANAPAGTVAVSGSSQAGWTLTTNAAHTYIAVGGEFPSVGDPAVPQQGLVRYAVHSVAPDKVGPQGVTAPTVAAGSVAGSATLSWTAGWDRDNETLTYSVYRDSLTTPIYTTKAASTFWQLPAMSYTDPLVPAGAHTYYLVVSDPDSNQVRVQVTLAAGVVTTRSVLPNGDHLDAGEGLVSPNGSYIAKVDATTGALTIVTAAGASVWASPVAAGPGAHLVMQSDGNLVLYDANWKSVWSTSTFGNKGVELVLRNDATLALTNAVATVVLNQVGPQLVVAPTVTAGMTPGTAKIAWAAGWDLASQTMSYAIYRDAATTALYTTSVASSTWKQPLLSYTDPSVPAGAHTYYLVVKDPAGNQVKVSTVLAAGTVASPATSLASGGELDSGEGLASPNGSYQATVDAAGALSVTTTAGQAVWKSPTAAGADAHLVMQTDGNLVLYSSSWAAVWSTATYGNPNATLQLRNDGTLAVVTTAGPAVWVS